MDATLGNTTSIGGKLFQVKGNQKLAERGIRSGVFMIQGSEILAAPVNVYSNTFTFTPFFGFKIVGISGYLTYQSLGAGVYLSISNILQFTPSSATGQPFQSVPGTFDAAGGPSVITNGFGIFNSADRQGQFNPVKDAVLNPSISYDFSISSGFRAWAATDYVLTIINIHWEES